MIVNRKMRRFCIFALLSLTACVFADPFDEKTAYEMWDLNSLTLCNQREISVKYKRFNEPIGDEV